MRAIDAFFECEGNKLAAAKKAGYRGPDVFEHYEVRQEIERRQRALANHHRVTEDWIVSRLKAYADAPFQLARFKRVDAQGNLFWDFSDATQEDLATIVGIATEEYKEGRGPGARNIKKFKLEISDPKAALDSLARIMGMFNDRVTVSSETSIIERLQKGRERARLAKN